MLNNTNIVSDVKAVSENVSMGEVEIIKKPNLSENYAIITAKPFPDYCFRGWYINEDLISEERNCIFTPVSDVVYIAKFSLKERYIIGDANGTDTIDICDFICMKRYLSNKKNQISVCSADLNEDLNINSEDMVSLKVSLLSNDNFEFRSLSEIISDALSKINVAPENTTFFDIEYSNNLFDEENVTNGMYIYSDGTLKSNSNYNTSDYIECIPGDILRHQFDYNGTRYDNTEKPNYVSISKVAAYDSEKNFIADSFVQSITSYTIPQGASFIRFSYTTNWNNVFKNHSLFYSSSTAVLPYYKYGDVVSVKLKKEYAVQSDVKAFLPKEICCAVGTTIEIYNKQVCPSAEKYHFKWKCQIGKSLERKYSISGKKTGEYPLSLSIYDDDFNMLWSGSTVLKIVAPLSKSINLLTIGDSLSNGKVWLSELKNLSDSRISYSGTYSSNLYDSEGNLQLDCRHEGRSGWTSAKYLTAGDDYENPSSFKYVNPFYNLNKQRFDWNYYVDNTLGGKSPDAVQIFLGTNGISIDPTRNADNIKKIIDYIRMDDDNIPIYVVNTLYCSNQNGIGGQTATDGYTSVNSGKYKYEEDMKVYNLMVELNGILKEYDKVYFIPISLCHDSEYNFGEVEVKVNPRATQTEIIPIESVHPQAQGYYQMADIMYSCLSAYS